MKENIIEVIIVVLIIFTIAMSVAAPYFEAEAFKKFSTKKATYWDALVVNLRVEASK